MHAGNSHEFQNGKLRIFVKGRNYLHDEAVQGWKRERK
jgi:hypothetical protein